MIPLALALALLADDPAVAPRLTKPPELLTSVAPMYPDAARAEGRGGTVALKITLDATGAVDRVEVVAGAGADLDWAALGAGTQFTFSPAEIDGKPAAPVDEPERERRHGNPDRWHDRRRRCRRRRDRRRTARRTRHARRPRRTARGTARAN